MNHHHAHHRHRHHSRLHHRAERIPVDIPVTLTSVLTAADDALLSDLTEHGALIVGASLPPGAQFQIDYAGQTVYGVAVWSEHDRFGARFPFELHDGPLFDRLEQARMEHEVRQRVLAAPSVPPPRDPAGFGRRGLH